MLITADLVLFDLDETLLDHRGAQAMAASWMREALRPDLSNDEALTLWRELEDKHFPRFLAGELSYQQQRRERLREFCTGRLWVDDHDFDSTFDQYRTIYEAAWAAFPDALRCLARAAESGARVAVLTNGDQDNQQQKARMIGIPDEVPVLAATLLGAAKPLPEAYRAALEHLGADAATTAMVGDDRRNDVDAARAAGLTAVWLDRTGQHARSGQAVESLDDLEFRTVSAAEQD